MNKEQLIINPTYNRSLHRQIIARQDCVRYSLIALALTNLKKDGIIGSIAELGVFRGTTSKLIHNIDPNRKFFLFDTFEGFPHEQLDKKDDERFKNTSLEIVKNKLGDSNNVFIRKGVFPETAKGLEQEKFSFVLIDVDLYIPTYQGLEFFYPRMVSGGYMLIHDYNNPQESERAVFRAVNEFMKGKPEKPIEIPDRFGSIVLRKN
jgi:O-methyltransferase